MTMIEEIVDFSMLEHACPGHQETFSNQNYSILQIVSKLKF